MKRKTASMGSRILPGARIGVCVFVLAFCAGEAQAIIGMPATPVSYAGVARRTVRRSACYCSVPSTGTVTAGLPEKPSPPKEASASAKAQYSRTSMP
jgi:hypothetical protein